MKYDISEHTAVLTEIITLQTIVNETQDKIIKANNKLIKIKKAQTKEKEKEVA